MWMSSKSKEMIVVWPVWPFKDFAKSYTSIDPKQISGKQKKESQDFVKDTAKADKREQADK